MINYGLEWQIMMNRWLSILQGTLCDMFSTRILYNDEDDGDYYGCDLSGYHLLLGPQDLIDEGSYFTYCKIK